MDNYISGNIDVNNLGDIATSVDTLNSLILLALCILGFQIGWRKVLSGMGLYIVFIFLTDGDKGSAEEVGILMVIVTCLCTVKWSASKIVGWCRRLFSKKEQRSLTEETSVLTERELQMK